MVLALTYFIYFIIYSFLGYICEVIYVSIGNRHLTNRGYLYGPICPIYGFGAIIVILSLSWAIKWPAVVFILGLALTTILEYIVSYLMELIFHMRWWDYSKRKLNINGRVCLLNSTLFAILVMILMYGLHPFVVVPLLKLLPNELYFYIIGFTLMSIFIVDFIISTIKTLDKSKLILKLQDTLLDLENRRIERVTNIDYRILGRLKKINQKYPSIRVKSKLRKARIALYEIIDRIESKINGD